MSSSTGSKAQGNKTLPSLLRHFVGVELVVEVKTGRMYQGELTSADDYMNLMLDGVKQIKFPDFSRKRPRTEETANNSLFDLMHVRGSNVRYIHFPPQLDLSAVVRAGIDRERAAANKYRRGIRK